VVAAGPSDGERTGPRKIAGDAQYRKREAVIQHGSLTFSVDAARHLGVFADPPVTADEFRGRIVGMDDLVDVDRADAVATVEASLADWAGAAAGSTVDADGSWTDAELERAEELAEEKYRNEEWIRTRPGGGA